jgi:hypothetical protein
MGIDYRYFAYGVILEKSEIEDEYPETKEEEDLDFASFDHFTLISGTEISFFGVSKTIASDEIEDELNFDFTDIQTWSDAMKSAKNNFDKTSLAKRAKFFVFMTTS